jgi:hypothetical protein
MSVRTGYSVRLFRLYHEIREHQPQTLAGLAVVARAHAFYREELWPEVVGYGTNIDGELATDDPAADLCLRNLIEAICKLAGAAAPLMPTAVV